MTIAWREARIALRALRRGPGFSAAVVAILALGVGANASIFGAFRAVMLRPLPYREPERLVMIPGSHRPNEVGEEISPANFLDLRRECRSFVRLGVIAPASLDLVEGGRPELLRGAQVSPAALEALGIEPFLGRLFRPEEEGPESRVAILTYGLWKSRFARDPGIVGRTIRLSGIAYPVVGVLRPGFYFPRRLGDDVRILVPFRITPERARDRQSRWVYAIGRLQEGTTLAAARAEVEARMADLARRHPLENEGWSARVVPLREHLVGRFRPAFSVLLATSLLVLLAAGANVGNLLLARATARRPEMAVRAVLGASASQLFRPLLLEGMALALAGGAAGILVAAGGLRLLLAAAPLEIPRLSEARVDPAVVLFTLAISVLAGLAFGVVPALIAWRSDPARDLRRREGGAAGGANVRMRRLVTISEVAAALVLLVGAGLLLSSLRRLLRVDPGFDPSGVATVEIVLPASRYPDGARQSAFFRELTLRAAALPGVESAGAVSHLPLSGSNSTDGYLVEGQIPADPNEIPEAPVRTITPGYLETLRIPVLAGRGVLPSDTRESEPVVLVNRSFAERYWGIGEAVGQRIFFAGSQGRSAPHRVVGVVGDIRHGGLGAPPVPEVYVAADQHPPDAMTLAARSRAPEGLAAALRAEVARLDPEQPVFHVRTLGRVVEESTSEPRFYAALVSSFAGLALALATLGISSVLAYSAALRRREMGIRLALGAPRGSVVGLVVREAMALAGAGIAAGLAAAALGARGISTLLFGIEPRDPAVFAATAALLAGVALAASLVPAVRSARIDPAAALRSDSGA